MKHVNGECLNIRYKRESSNEVSIWFDIDGTNVGDVYGRDSAKEIMNEVFLINLWHTYNKIRVEQKVIDYCNRRQVKLDFNYEII